MKVIFEDANVRISLSQREGENACVCFTGVGHALGGIDAQKEEFTRLNNVGVIIFITDKKRSWGNFLEFPQIIDTIASYLDGKEIYSLGNSMGGFLSVIFTRYIKVKCSVSFVSQYSVSKKIIPTENRWNVYTNKINKFKYPSLDGHFVNSTNYYFFSGDHPAEKQHWEKFPKGQNIRNFVLCGQAHNIAESFKKKGILYDLISKCFLSQGIENDLINSQYKYEVY